MKYGFLQVAILLVIAGLAGSIVNAVRPGGIPWRAQPLPELAVADTTDIDEADPWIVRITLAQAKVFYDKGTPFIDARERDYFDEGHIAKAWPSDNFMEVVFRLDSLQGRTAPLVTYCDGTECGSSEELAYDFQSVGFQTVFVFQGGWSEWLEAGYPVTR